MKKKLALSTTAIAVLASTIPTHVAPVEAEETGKNIYTKFDSSVGNNVSAGTGEENRPFNLFKDAIEAAKDGDTIVIVDKGFINDGGGNLPFHIDKAVTIVAGTNNARLEVNAAGIILGKDVTFENIQLNFANPIHDAIFANGHTLNLINVTRYEKAREIDLFAGGLYRLGESTPLYQPGNNGVINVSTDDTLDSTVKSEFGNIYAGSMNGNFSGDAEINVSRLNDSKKLTVKGIYGSGALEATVSDNWFEGAEPEPPLPLPEQFKMAGDVVVSLDDYQVPIDGTTGFNDSVTVETRTKNPNTLKLKNINILSVLEGKVNPASLDGTTPLTSINNIHVEENAILDLTGMTGTFTTNKYTGRGSVVLPTKGLTLNITESISEGSTLNLLLDGYNPILGDNGQVTEDQVYITTPADDEPINFERHYADTKYELRALDKGSHFEWTAVDPKKLPVPGEPQPDPEEPEEQEPTLTELQVLDGDTRTMSVGDFDLVNLTTVDYTLNMVTTPDLEIDTWLDEFNPTVKVGDYTAEPVKDNLGYIYYRVDELDVTIYFEPANDGDFQHQKMKVQFVDDDGTAVSPQALTYEFEISTDSADPLSLSLTVNGDEGIEGGDTTPAQPVITDLEQVDKTKTITAGGFKDGVVPYAEFEFKVITDPPLTESTRFDTFNPEVVIDSRGATKVGDGGDITYRAEDSNMTIYFEPVEGDDPSLQKMVVQFKDENGMPVDLEDNEYSITINIDKTYFLTFDLTVNEGEGEYKDPILTGLTAVGDSNKTMSITEFSGDEQPTIEYELNMQTDVPITNEFLLSNNSVGLAVNNNVMTQPLMADGKTYYYRNDDLDLSVYFESIDDNPQGQKMIVKFEDEDGNPVAPTQTTYSIVILHDGISPLALSLVVEPVEVKPTIPVISQFNVSDATKAVDANADFRVEYPFTVVGTNNETDIDLSNYRLEFNFDGSNAVYRGDTKDYYIADSDVTVKVEKAEGDNAYKLVVTGNSSELKEGNHQLKMGVVDGEATTTFNLNVDEPEEVTPTLPPSGGGEGIDPPTQEGGSTTEPTNPPSTGGTTGGGTTTGGTTGGNTGGSSTGGNTGGGTTTEPTTPPSTGGNTGGGTTTPPTTEGGTTTTPPSQEEVTPQPTPVPPTTEEVTNRVDNLDDLTVEFQQKVDSLMTDIAIQDNGTIIDLVGDNDDLSNVDTLELTPEGLFINVEGEKVKFNTELDLSNIDWDNTRVIRVGGGAVPHKQNGEGLTITTSNFNNLLITSKEPEPFTDVNDDDWFKQDVEDMFNYGFTTGTTATTYSPNESINRAQFAVMLARAFELQQASKENTLSDIGDKWYASEVQALVDAGIIKGFNDGTFGGEKNLTRQQAATMLVNVLKYLGVNTEVTEGVQFSDLDKIGEHAKGSVEYLASKGVLVNGEDVNFNPYKNLTRAQMAKMLVKSVRLTGLY